MAERKKSAPKKLTPKEPTQRESRPMVDPENREQQLVSLAVDLAEKQLRDGTASAAVIQHYLKIASRREIIERQILEKQAALIDAKTQTIVKEKEQEELTKKALEAMKNYHSSSQS